MTVKRCLTNDKYAYLLTALGSATEGAYNTDASVVSVQGTVLPRRINGGRNLVGLCCSPVWSMMGSSRSVPPRQHSVSDAGTDDVQAKEESSLKVLCTFGYLQPTPVDTHMADSILLPR